MYFLVAINTKQFWIIPKEKCIPPFVDIALAFFDSLFNSFLFDVTYFSLLLKSFLFPKLATSLLLAKFACFDLAAIFSNVNLLNAGVVIYLSWLWSVIFFLISWIFVL